jgi:hypothetical protein
LDPLRPGTEFNTIFATCLTSVPDGHHSTRPEFTPGQAMWCRLTGSRRDGFLQKFTEYLEWRKANPTVSPPVIWRDSISGKDMLEYGGTASRVRICWRRYTRPRSLRCAGLAISVERRRG